jgi:hypothetical protein
MEKFTYYKRMNSVVIGSRIITSPKLDEVHGVKKFIKSCSFCGCELDKNGECVNFCVELPDLPPRVKRINKKN